ncbi:MAG TPA: gamma-glutamyltransferase [Pseudolabrys sp.]|jgi:gamma-glutamyltranspeptidase/glutathione hydrolase|nr:gamma-glutamyltransferase [Pseudolabrys sp.]
MSRDFQLPGRSPVIACDGMAATSHPLATLAAIDVLREGGNAADAAVTACATLCVVEPHMTGIGGDCFVMLAKPGQPAWGYNGSGRAASAASAEALRAQGLADIGTSIHAVTVPGAVEAWEATLKAYGTIGLDRALRPAIGFAENGFPVAARVAFDWARFVTRLKSDPGTAKHYLFNGAAPKEGNVIRLPALAKTLRAVAAKGARAIYQGEIADDMAATLAAHGSLITADDIATHKGEVVTPISSNYRGLDVFELPPNGQGLTALVMLNILETFDMKSLDALGPERFHLMLEAARIGYAVRDTHIADPKTMRIDVAKLLDKAWAKTLAAKIDPARRADLPKMPTPGNETTYISIVDKDRMAVSFINTLYSNFGYGLCTEKTGIVFTNRGSCFTLEAGHPNVFGPSKRPMHTIIPALAMRDNRVAYSFGVMGAHYQPMGHVQIVLNLIDYGMDVQQAIEAPRAFFVGEDSAIERGMPAATIEGLKKRGHRVTTPELPWGGAQIINIDWERGVLIAGSESRKDGCALGY